MENFLGFGFYSTPFGLLKLCSDAMRLAFFVQYAYLCWPSYEC